MAKPQPRGLVPQGGGLVVPGRSERGRDAAVWLSQASRQVLPPAQPLGSGSGPRPAGAGKALSVGLPVATVPPGDAAEAFERWARGIVSAGIPRPSPESVQQGVALARERRDFMSSLIRRDPRSALGLAVPWAVRQRLPVEVQALLEERVSARGRFEVLCAMAVPGAAVGPLPGEGGWQRTFESGGRVYRAFVYGRRLTQGTTDDAAFQGIAIGDLLAVDDRAVRAVDPEQARWLAREGKLAGEAVCVLTGEPAATWVERGGEYLPVRSAALAGELERRLASLEPGFRGTVDPPSFGQWSHGVKRVLFMRARFPDDLREPVTQAEATEVMRQANEFFQSGSYHVVSLITTVGPLVTLPQPKLYYAVKGPAALLRDAREATRLAGLESSVFDLDMVRFERVPGFDWGGLASVGGKGLWLQSSGLGVVCHELGHNLGLGHANFWDTVRPALPDPTQNLPFDADSLVGYDGVIGPGDDVEYGDPFDVMGSGGGASAHFHALHKRLLGWIPDAAVAPVTRDGVYRVHAHDLGVLGGDLPFLLRIRKDSERFYWVSVRGAQADNPWLSDGVELHWNNWHQAIGSGELLDTTPGSGNGKDDAALALGRTFVDEGAQVFITPLRRVWVDLGGTQVPACDVAVRFGPFPDNQPPEMLLESSSLQVAVGQPVVFTVTASDPDGDPLAVSWDLGGGLPGPSAMLITNAWSTVGEHVVRCEVSDLKGGSISRHRVVRVGNPRTLRISGMVMDGQGRPLPGVRMHNGRYGTNGPYAPEFRWAYTDSEGRYTLTGLEAGEYEVGGFLAGFVTRPLNFTRPLILNQFTGVGVDFIAAALPRVSVRTLSDGDEAASRSVVFEVSRVGPTNEALTVYFRNAGSAAADEDYRPWGAVEVQTNIIPTVQQPVVQAIPFGYVDLGPGVVTTNLSFPVLPDAVAEGDETLALTLQYPVTRTLITETETNTVDIPGWQVEAENGRQAWFQTRPFYQLGMREEAVALIRDASPAGETAVSIAALERGTSENAGDTASFLISRTGRVPAAALRVPLDVGGTATPDDDYPALPAFVVLPVGVDTVRVTVLALDDRFVEGDESVVVQIGAGAGYRVGNASARVLIIDDDLPLVSVTATQPVVAEGGSGARVTFQRSGDSSQALEVDYLVGGSATPGQDYRSLLGRVVIPAGAAGVGVDILPLDDRLLEGDETVEITVGDSPTYNAVAPSRAVVIVRDDEYPSVTVEATDDSATEGADDPGEFLFRRTGALDRPLEVRYRWGGSAVHQADFVASGDRIVIPAGQSSVRLAVIPIDDGIPEDPETIALELEPDPAYTLGASAGAGGTLLDVGDTTVAVGFSLLASRFPESRTDPEIVVHVSANPEDGEENAVTVAWEVLGGSATAGTDYVLTNGTLVFAYANPDGDGPLSNRVATIPLTVVDDLLAETDETVVVRLRIAPTVIPSEDTNQPPQSFTNGLLDVYAVHTFTIVDDDRSSLRVWAGRATTSEGSDVPASFVVERLGRTNLAQEVRLHWSGLATSGADYLAIPDRITLAPGQIAMELPVVAVDDPVMEYRENVVLTLVDAPGSTLSSASQAAVFIEDDDGTIEFLLARQSVREDAGVARVLVRRTGDSSLAMTAVFEASALTALPARETNGLVSGDFVPTNTVVSFAPGETLKEVGVILLDDRIPDGTKTVRLGLSRGSSLFPLGGQNTSVLTLVDDDGLLSTGTNQVAAAETEPVLRVILERSGPSDQALVADYETVDGMAIAGQDYVGVSGRLEFPAGETRAEILVPLLNDFLVEGDEGFLVRLSTPGGEAIGEAQATIVDDDCSVAFALSTVEVDEDEGVLEVGVVRSGSALKPVRVGFAAVSDTATEGDDFEPTRGELIFRGNRFETLTNGTGEVVFRPGETNQTLTVRIWNDGEGERDETFHLVLDPPQAGSPGLSIPFVTLGESSNLVVVIRDNEAPGRLDDGFQPGLGADGPVRALALQADGKVLVGGEFSMFDGVVLPRLARLHADGFVDRSFNPGLGLDGPVLAVAEVADGRILVGGGFTNVDGVPHQFLARLEPDGTPSAATAPNPDAAVWALASGEDGAVFVGGDFQSLGPGPHAGVFRLNRGGNLDPGFVPSAGAGRRVRALLASDGGGVWVGGDFERWDAAGGRHLVRLGADGALDPGFDARGLGLNGPVRALAAAPDGSLYLGGDFTSVGGFPRAGVARLNGGILDPGFDPGGGATAPVLALGLHAGDRPLVAGVFEQFDGNPAGRFVRLQPGGGGDPAFFRGEGANDIIRAVVVQPDGAFLIGGDFTEVHGRPRRRIARVHADEKFAEGFVEFETARWEAPETAEGVWVGVQRTGSAKSVARVGYRVSDGTARAGEDYDPVAGELVFAVGETHQQFRVALRDDLLAEGNETVLLTLTNAVGAFPGRISSAVLVLEDNEAAVAFELPSVGVAESAPEVSVVVRRSGSVLAPATVTYRSTQGTATEGEDYLPVSGSLSFPPGVATLEVRVPLRDDQDIEGNEEFQLVLADPQGGVALGSQSILRVTLLDDDRLPTHHTLTLSASPGGRAAPGSGRFPTNTVVQLRAIPDRSFEFARWEGTLVSADNPLALRMDRNHVLTARFRPRDYLETFESGDLRSLPWRTSASGGWRVTDETASSGRYAARSGDVPDGGASVLLLERETPGGGASFDFRTASETGWDFLEFLVDGVRVERWSGLQGWQTFQFNLAPGGHRLEWRFQRDRTFGGAEDAVWIDNLDLPEALPPALPPHLTWEGGGLAGCKVRVFGQRGYDYVLEVSVDLAGWQPVDRVPGEDQDLRLSDPACGLGRSVGLAPGRFYRVRVE